jgi:hypothetical protein
VIGELVDRYWVRATRGVKLAVEKDSSLLGFLSTIKIMEDCEVR